MAPEELKKYAHTSGATIAAPQIASQAGNMIVFLHTGGSVALFAYSDRLQP